ncbi:MAG: carbon-nitrogen hydrolase family protein [Chitinophagaceae bacterium]
MKICVAQTKPLKGDINENIVNHQKLIDLAVQYGAELIVFPELSITGYEPELAETLATDTNDIRFDVFQSISNDKDIQICIGMPLKTKEGIEIATFIFKPNHPLSTYSKQYLHADEFPYFKAAKNQDMLIEQKNKVALAICYEISVPAHINEAVAQQANIYIASVAKSVTGMENAINRLSEIAIKDSLFVLIANCVGYCDNFNCGGKSSAWNNSGFLLGQLNDTSEGVLIIDTLTGKVFNSQQSARG